MCIEEYASPNISYYKDLRMHLFLRALLTIWKLVKMLSPINRIKKENRIYTVFDIHSWFFFKKRKA